jgi:hypothetical protein
LFFLFLFISSREMGFRSRTYASSTGSSTQDGETSNSGANSEEKAKARRAQVRRAQVQHRQRKANYVKQLEIDIAHIRDMISKTQRETHALQGENDAMRDHIQLAVNQMMAPEIPVYSPQPGLLPPSQPTTVGEIMASMGVLDQPAGLGLGPLDDLTLSLQLDDVMGTPAYQISSSPSSSHYATSTTHSSPALTSIPHLPEMTPEQTQQAINFILAYVVS